jgi:20S proteasome alpha/beta subunit
MTVAIGFLCHDGIVVGADSMLTPSMGGLNVGHHKGQKVHIIAGNQLFAFAGDQGQAARFQIMADGSHQMAGTVGHAVDYPLALTQALIQQFHNTGIGNQINVNTLLGFEHAGQRHLCVFEGLIQPRLLDAAHYYVALGSGKLSADPFLRFLVDIFCLNGPPSVREATFLTAWAIQHVIDTNPGGVAGPIRIAVMESGPMGGWQSRPLSDNEIEDHNQAIESARQSLRDWRESLSPPANGDEQGEDIPPPPTA